MPKTKKVLFVPLKDIHVGDRLRRRDEAQVSILSPSIHDHGVIKPITVYRGPDDRLHLVDGAHRWWACKKLGLPTIQAVVLSSNIDPALAEIISNLHRGRLNALERAEHVWAFLKVKFAAAATSKAKVGRPKTPMAMALDEKTLGPSPEARRKRAQRAKAIAELPDAVKTSIIKHQLFGRLKILRELTRLDTEKEQLQAVQRVAAGGAVEPKTNPPARKPAQLSKAEKRVFRALQRRYQKLQKFQGAFTAAPKVVKLKFVKECLLQPSGVTTSV